jgi:hypothetical protein
MLVDEFLPVYDVSDAVATVVQAEVATTWDALMQVGLIEVGRTRPMVGFLGALRALPEVVSHLLHGESPPQAPKRLRLHDTTSFPFGEGGGIYGSDALRFYGGGLSLSSLGLIEVQNSTISNNAANRGTGIYGISLRMEQHVFAEHGKRGGRGAVHRRHHTRRVDHAFNYEHDREKHRSPGQRRPRGR